MKNSFITSLLWIVLVFITNMITTDAYNYIYFPLVEASSHAIEYGSPIPDLLLLVAYTLTFGFAGAILAWRMKTISQTLVSAILLGAVGLSLELAVSIPWFQLMPAHPSLYDHSLAFVGSLSLPLSAGFGAYLYNRLTDKR